MDLEGAAGVVLLLLHWRAVLCLLIGSVGAVLLVQHFPWFTGLQGIVVAALGLLPGVIWEEAVRPSPGSSPGRATSTAVAVLAAIIFGAVWGAVSSSSVHSAMAGVVVFVGAAWAWYRYAVVYQGWLLREQGILCTLAAAVAYPSAALLAHNAF
jgi:hypothetical protein